MVDRPRWATVGRSTVYGWLWRKLPGPWPVKLLESLVLLTGVLAVLFLVVFPWVEPRLPFTDVTVDSTSTGSVP